MIAWVEKMSKNLSKVAQALEDLYMVADIEDRPQSLLKEKPYDRVTPGSPQRSNHLTHKTPKVPKVSKSDQKLQQNHGVMVPSIHDQIISHP